jgi:DTW domain-containing protein
MSGQINYMGAPVFTPLEPPLPSLASSPPNASQRACCAVCLRPQRSCICGWIRRIETHVQVVVLQHPLEVHQAKGSARLLHLCLNNSQLVIGEVFCEPPWHDDGLVRRNLLLYPTLEEINPRARREEKGSQGRHSSFKSAIPDSGNSARHVELSSPNVDPKHIRLIVIDGTWRKTRKMLYLNPLLAGMTRLSLSSAALQSRYLIRKAQRRGQFSTFEACCAALALLEDRAEPYAALLEAFDGFVAQQQAYSA